MHVNISHNLCNILHIHYVYMYVHLVLHLSLHVHVHACTCRTAGDGLPLGVVTDSKSSMRRDSSREQEEEGPSKEESKRKIHAGHHDNTHGTNFIKRNIEVYIYST